ncbi:Ferritin heavy chain [Lemmus lemmus]
MEIAFPLELTLNQSLVALHRIATSKSDAHLCDFLQNHFLSKQAQVLKEMSSYVTTLRQKESPEDGMAEYLFGKLTLTETNKEN